MQDARTDNIARAMVLGVGKSIVQDARSARTLRPNATEATLCHDIGSEAQPHMLWVTDLYNELLQRSCVQRSLRNRVSQQWHQRDAASTVDGAKSHALYANLSAVLWTEHSVNIDDEINHAFMHRYFPPECIHDSHMKLLRQKQLQILSSPHETLFGALQGLLPLHGPLVDAWNNAHGNGCDHTSAKLCQIFAECARVPICLCTVTDTGDVAVVDAAGMFQCLRQHQANETYTTVDMPLDLELLQDNVVIKHPLPDNVHYPVCVVLCTNIWVVAIPIHNTIVQGQTPVVQQHLSSNNSHDLNNCSAVH